MISENENGPVPENPFRPGAGQRPVYLAGRTAEHDEFKASLSRRPVSQNIIITGLRGVGKTVLLDTLKPVAQSTNWLWTGNDLSESSSLTEERIARRLVVDLSALLAPIMVQSQQTLAFGFNQETSLQSRPLEFNDLWQIYEAAPGLISDKLKAVFLRVGKLLSNSEINGVVFAYDEAQNLSDHALSKEFPLSQILDLFSFLQRQDTGTNFLLVLTGLPTIFPKLNEARTYTERMFHVMHLQSLNDLDAREAIVRPIEITASPLGFADQTIDLIIKNSGGYPYFIQFICREVFDTWIGKMKSGLAPSIPTQQILEKLDQDFFSPRWARSTDRQQQFMKVIASLSTSEDEFSVPEIVNASRDILKKGFTPSHAVQILQSLAEKGLIYKSRRGGYCFAVPLLNRFIQRQSWDPSTLHVDK